MGYYIRILGTNPDPFPKHQLVSTALPATLAGEGDTEDWTELVLGHPSGAEIAFIERNIVVDGELGAEEIQEFLEEIAICKPESGAEWLREFLPAVKVIYAFQLLDGTDVDDGWTILHRVYGTLWKHAGGILQADGEGLTNLAGHTIVWQFSNSASGPWNCAVINKDAVWTAFQMDLANPAQRQAFQDGEVPAGATVLAEGEDLLS